MKKFYYFSLLLGLMLGTLVFTACGSDDDEPSTGGDIVGTWTASFALDEIDEYEHELTYVFKKDGTFDMTTFSIMEEGFKDWGLRLVGTYTANNGKLTLNLKKYWIYDGARNGTDAERWQTGDNADGSADIDEWDDFGFDPISNPLVLDYSIEGNKLKLNNGQYLILEVGNSVISGTLTKK